MKLTLLEKKILAFASKKAGYAWKCLILFLSILLGKDLSPAIKILISDLILPSVSFPKQSWCLENIKPKNMLVQIQNFHKLTTEQLKINFCKKNFFLHIITHFSITISNKYWLEWHAATINSIVELYIYLF